MMCIKHYVFSAICMHLNILILIKTAKKNILNGPFLQWLAGQSDYRRIPQDPLIWTFSMEFNILLHGICIL